MNTSKNLEILFTSSFESLTPITIRSNRIWFSLLQLSGESSRHQRVVPVRRLLHLRSATLCSGVVVGGEVRHMVSRILYPGSRGQHAPSFTMTELSPGVVGLVGDAWRSSAFEHRQMGRDSLRWSTSAFLQAAIWYTGRVSCCQGPSFSPVLVTGFLAVNPTAGGPKLSLICALVWILLVTG